MSKPKQGTLLGSGIDKKAYTIPGDDQNIALWTWNERAEDEWLSLAYLDLLGFPVLLPKRMYRGKAGPYRRNQTACLIVPRAFCGIRGDSGNVAVGLILNEKTIADVELIRAKLEEHGVSITDIQFLFGADGSVFVSDPGTWYANNPQYYQRDSKFMNRELDRIVLAAQYAIHCRKNKLPTEHFKDFSSFRWAASDWASAVATANTLRLAVR